MILYTSKDCSRCVLVKELLKKNGVPFREEDAQEHLEKLHGKGLRALPIIQIDDNYYSIDSIPALLNILKKNIDKIVSKEMDLKEVEREAQNVKSVLEFAEKKPDSEKEAIINEVRESLDAVMDQGLAYFRKKRVPCIESPHQE